MTQLSFGADELNNAVSEENTNHESNANTDYGGDTSLELGYPFSDPFGGGNLVMYIPCHEPTGTTAHDVSTDTATAHDGTINGPTLGANGILGRSAFEYASANSDRVTIPDHDDFDNSAFTVIAWVYPDGLGANSQIITKRDTFNSNITFELMYQDTLDWRIHDGVQNTNLGVTPDFTDQTWHSACGRYDPNDTDNEMAVFLDGGNKATAAHSNSPPTNAADVTIGALSNGNEGWDGRIAEILIVDYALSDAQIATISDPTSGSLITPSKTS